MADLRPPSEAKNDNGTFYDDVSPSEAEDMRFGGPAADSGRQTPIHGATGPVGEPGLPPSRPTSIATGTSSQAPLRSTVNAPRRPLASARGSWNNDTSRPASPNSVSSRTHVPNLTSAAFFKPMSSRKLREEARRTTLPSSPTTPVALEPEMMRKSMETSRSVKQHRHRNSNASVVTIEQNQRPLVDSDAPPLPSSRGGLSRDGLPSDGTGSGAQSDEQQLRTLRGQGSNVPLRQPGLDQDDHSGAFLDQKMERPSRSASSFRQSLVWNRAADRGEERKPNGHRRLESGPSSPVAMPEKPHTQSSNRSADLGRNYEYYNGNAVFFLQGRLLNARQRPLNALTGFLAVLPATLFFAFSAPFLWHHVSPAVPILFAYVFWVCMSSYAHASFSDPGIIPRNLHPHPPDPATDDPLALGPPTSNWVTVRSFGPSATGTSNTAMEVPIKYCKSCNIWRPPRAHHCRVCDACMETQDHHCVWLNNCVGRRNYRFFFTFVASGTILAFFLLTASLAHILVWRSQNHASFGTAISHDWSQRGAFAMFIYSLFVFPYPASLWGYHMFLMSRGESTREYLNSHKFLKKDRHRPFSQHNVLRNIVSVLCRPRPPSYMRFKGYYHPGDQRLGETQRRQYRNLKRPNDVEKGGLEMKEMNGKSSVGFQGPRSRTPLNSTPRLDTAGPSVDKT